MLCTGCETDTDFDYCRACGFVVPVPNDTARKYLNQHPMGSRLLAETIARAKGHQGPPDKPVSFSSQPTQPMKTDSPSNALITPLPWRALIGDDEDGEFFSIVSVAEGKGIDYIADVIGERSASNAEANAEYLVKAANAYPQLVALLKTALTTADFEKHPHRPWHMKARELLATL